MGTLVAQPGAALHLEVTFKVKDNRGLFGFSIECFKVRVSLFFSSFYHMEFFSLWPSKINFYLKSKYFSCS